MALHVDRQHEWLETDGLGGFASGTTSGIRTRRYHALLLVATTPPTGRMLLVNGFEAWVDTPSGTYALSSQLYPPDVIHPDGMRWIEVFESDPWPHWDFVLEDGTRLEQEIFIRHGMPLVALSWRLRGAQKQATLSLRPLLSGRDYHATHHENASFRFDADVHGDRVVWRPYPDVPGIVSLTNATYRHQPDWYRNFLYVEEQQRGLDHTEDLASPGVLRWDLAAGEAVWLLAPAAQEDTLFPADTTAPKCLQRLRTAERQRRRRFASPLHQAADAYLVQRGHGQTIVAGYPWFTDWGRDTFIALRGLCLATGRLDDARTILCEWATTVSDGMLPNRFPDSGGTPEFNAVDASLWYVVAVYELLQAMKAKKRKLVAREQQLLHQAIEAVLAGYARGTRYNIHLDSDGLLAAGQPGVQLTWMDARVEGQEVTPRIGKPVEIAALWLNALWIGSQLSASWQEVYDRGREAFQKRFWDEAGGYLVDVVDPDHQAGTVDPTFRPNQILAVGGLPLTLLEANQARRVVEAVEARLLTPMGLRSLAPGEPGYAPRCAGGVPDRDRAYHQGTVWPWLMGPFIEAWVRVHGNTSEAKQTARVRYLTPLLQHLDTGGLGHVAEIADAEPPHTPRGCPFQAWSLAEVLRLDQIVLAK